MNFSVKGNIVKLYGIIWDGDGAYISNKLEALEGTDELIIRLHTPGGSVIDGNMIGNTLKSLNRKIHIIIDGMAASMGAVLLTFADKVSIRQNAFIMIHEPQGGGLGTAKDLRSVADVLESMRSNFITVFTSRTGKSVEDVEKWLDGDNWFDALQAQSEGLVDAIEDLVIPQEQMNALRKMKLTALYDSPKSEADKKFLFENNSQLNNSKKIEMNKSELILALGLKGITAESSDTAIINAIKEQQKVADDKAIKATSELKALQDAEKEAKTAAIKTVVEKAVTDGKIKADQKETFIGIGTASGIDALNTTFEAMGTRQLIIDKIKDGATATAQGRDAWDWDKWQKEDSKGLEAMEKTNLEAFKALFKGKYGVEYKQ